MRERKDWTPYFRVIADRLALKDWQVTIKDEAPADCDHVASVATTEGRKVAGVWLSEEFLKRDGDYQRHTVVHELIHLHHAYVDHLGLRHVGDKQRELIKAGLEYMVDGLADAISPMLPLPSEVIESK